MKPSSYLTLAAVMLLIVSSFSGCTEPPAESTEATAEPAFDLAAAKVDIIAANDEFEKYLAAGDSTGLAGLYTEDAKFMMNGAPAFVGRDAIESIFSAIMQSGITAVELTTVDVWGSEDLITEEGGLTLYAGDIVADQGKYMVLWKKVDGQWHLFRDIFNSDLAPEQ